MSTTRTTPTDALLRCADLTAVYPYTLATIRKMAQRRSPKIPTPCGTRPFVFRVSVEGLIMRHPLDRSIASDLSYECLQKRRRAGELAAPRCEAKSVHGQQCERRAGHAGNHEVTTRQHDADLLRELGRCHPVIAVEASGERTAR